MRQLRSISYLVATLAMPASAVNSLPDAPIGSKTLSTRELRNLVVGRNIVWVKSVGMNSSTSYHNDGTYDSIFAGIVANYRSGRYTIEDQQVCEQDSERGCFVVAKYKNGTFIVSSQRKKEDKYHSVWSLLTIEDIK